MTAEQVEANPLIVEPGVPADPRPDGVSDPDLFYGKLSTKQRSLIRQAVSKGESIDVVAERYGVDPIFVERAVKKLRAPRSKATNGNAPAEPLPAPRQRARKQRKDMLPDNAKIPDISDDELLNQAGVEPVYSTNDVGDFFDKSNQWLYWGLRGRIFTWEDGTPIVPERVGGDPIYGNRRFTLPVIRGILMSAYRRGTIKPDKFKVVLRRIRIAEMGGNWKSRENWAGRQLEREVAERQRAVKERKNRAAIRRAFKGGESINDLAARYGVAPEHIEWVVD